MGCCVSSPTVDERQLSRIDNADTATATSTTQHRNAPTTTAKPTTAAKTKAKPKPSPSASAAVTTNPAPHSNAEYGTAAEPTHGTGAVTVAHVTEYHGPAPAPVVSTPAPSPAEVSKFALRLAAGDSITGKASRVADGDTLSLDVPVPQALITADIQALVQQRDAARKRRDFTTADQVRDQLKAKGIDVQDGARKGDPSVVVTRLRVRFMGIDAPETKMPYGPEAGDYLRALLEGKQCRIKVCVPADRYGRIVADVFAVEADGSEIFTQESMLRAGWAWYYEAYDKRSHFKTLQQEARAARRGLWVQESPQEPWEWRKTHRRP